MPQMMKQMTRLKEQILDLALYFSVPRYIFVHLR